MINSTRLVTAVLGSALAGSALLAIPASAGTPTATPVAAPSRAPSEPTTTYFGRVVGSGDVNVRSLPTTRSSVPYGLSLGSTIGIVCKVRGTTVKGNSLWYMLPQSYHEWISAAYVDNVGPAPRWCGTAFRYAGRTTAKLTERVGPTAAERSAGTLARGTRISIVCKLDGTTVDGNRRWYWLSDHRWVSARYVDNIGEVPRWCQ